MAALPTILSYSSNKSKLLDVRLFAAWSVLAALVFLFLKMVFYACAGCEALHCSRTNKVRFGLNSTKLNIFASVFESLHLRAQTARIQYISPPYYLNVSTVDKLRTFRGVLFPRRGVPVFGSSVRI